MSEQPKLTVIYFDGAVAEGGTISLLKMIFDGLDRSKVRPKLISAAPYNLLIKMFKPTDIAGTLNFKLTYVDREVFSSKTRQFNKLTRKLAIYCFTLASWLLNTPAAISTFIMLYRERPDIIHTNNSMQPLFAAFLLNIPVIWHFHGPASKLKFPYSILHTKVSHYLTISKYIQNEVISANFPSRKISTLLNPAPTRQPASLLHQPIRSSFNITPNQIVISHIGRLIKWKGQLEFLKAFAISAQKTPNICALIIGDDTENFKSNYKSLLNQFVIDNGLSDKVTFTGHINNPLEILAQSDIVVHSSLEPEPFGLVITEAMSVGTAVICSNRGATQEIIQDGISGISCDPEDSNRLASLISRLATDTDMRNRIAENGMQRANTVFALEPYLEKLVRKYESIIARKKTFLE